MVEVFISKQTTMRQHFLVLSIAKNTSRLSGIALATALLAAGCGGNGDTFPTRSTEASTTEISVGSLRLIGQQVLPRRSEFAGTVVGGLSGIDYDSLTKRFILVSDDRTTGDSAGAPRMYFANLAYDANSFTGLTFTSTVIMKQPNGSTYPKVGTQGSGFAKQYLRRKSTSACSSNRNKPHAGEVRNNQTSQQWLQRPAGKPTSSG